MILRASPLTYKLPTAGDAERAQAAYALAHAVAFGLRTERGYEGTLATVRTLETGLREAAAAAQVAGLAISTPTMPARAPSELRRTARALLRDIRELARRRGIDALTGILLHTTR